MSVLHFCVGLVSALVELVFFLGTHGKRWGIWVEIGIAPCVLKDIRCGLIRNLSI